MEARYQKLPLGEVASPAHAQSPPPPAAAEGAGAAATVGGGLVRLHKCPHVFTPGTRARARGTEGRKNCVTGRRQLRGANAIAWPR